MPRLDGRLLDAHQDGFMTVYEVACIALALLTDSAGRLMKVVAVGPLIATALSALDWSVQERPPLFSSPHGRAYYGASPKNLLHGRALLVPIRGAFVGRTRL